LAVEVFVIGLRIGAGNKPPFQDPFGVDTRIAASLTNRIE
jgi:hypothetical protein